MSIFDFVKDAGKQMGIVKEGPTNEELREEIEALGLNVNDLGVEFNDGVVQVSGSTSTQEERERVILAM